MGYLVPALSEHPAPDDPAVLVRQALDWYTDDHLGLSEIARGLRASTSIAWRADYVRRLLGRAVYRGLVRHNGPVHPGLHEPLIDDDLWERTQRTTEARRVTGRETNRPKYLLSGLPKRRLCGGPMGAHNLKKPAASHDCTRRDSGQRPGTCIRMANAERAFLEELRDLARQGGDPGRITLMLADRNLPSQVEAIQRQLAAIPAQRQRIIEYASKGTIEDADLALQLQRLGPDEAERNSALKAVQRPRRIRAQDVRRQFRNLADVIEDPDLPMQQKRDVLCHRLAAITIHPDETVYVTLRDTSQAHSAC